MKDPITYYTQNVEKYTSLVTLLKRRLIVLSSIRLIVFLVTVISVYLLLPNWNLALLIGVVGVVVFVFLLSKFTDKKAKLALNKSLLSLNKEELEIQAGDFHNRDSGLQYQDPKHFFSYDVDLFGKGSLFQYINRTSLKSGKDELALKLSENNIHNITKRQEAIKELATQTDWMQNYIATGSLIKSETPIDKILNWLKSHSSFLPQYIKWVPWLFSVASLAIFILVISKVIGISLLGYWLLIGLGISGIYLKKISLLASNCDKVKATFRQYASLLNQIEQLSFTSELLVEKQKQIQLQHKKASAIVAEFSNHIDALDNRNNIFGAIFGNGYFLTDIKNAFKVEQWIIKYASTVQDWFEVVTFFDAYISFGVFTFNHPSFAFPDITDNSEIIKAQNLGHPMLLKTKRVSSDISINAQQFFIVTGANMAGKSTFLRTISLHIIMANVGLPICASSSQYKPIKLITSMRTSDSLTNDSSYFFSELTRLKFIVDAIANEPYFIILDEILKGTNSTDKAIGSKKFVKKLVEAQATGIIATHDLSLCEISDELNEVKNYFFDAKIVNNELYFDYKFKNGICQNMNASFLLKKMDII